MEKRMPSRRKSRAAKRRTFDVINPATGKALASYPIATAPQVRAKVEAARDAFRSWSRVDPKERAAYLLRFAEVLRKHKDAYAETMTLEMGKVIREAIAEVEKCAWAAEYFGENGPAFLQPELVATDAMRSYIAFHPRGVLGSIMPWNFPMWQIVRFAVPALIAGNTVVVKPASASPQSGCNLEIAFREAGLPAGVFQIVVGDRTTATALIHSPVSVVSLTGSVGTGVAVAREAANDLKKVILELGGSDPFIVAEDADLDLAAKGAVTGRFINCGQSCIAAKRFFVVDSLADEVVAQVAEDIPRLPGGDPLPPSSPGRRDRDAHRIGHGLRQRHGEIGSAHAVRRREAQRHRTGAEPLRPPGDGEHQDGPDLSLGFRRDSRAGEHGIATGGAHPPRGSTGLYPLPDSYRWGERVDRCGSRL